MAVDFTFPPEIDDLRARVRAFVDDRVRPAEAKIGDRYSISREDYMAILTDLRVAAREAELWLPHMPPEWGGMGLGHVAVAIVQAEAARSYYGPWALNCQAPDEGNMHTLLHWATDAQKERYLRPLCEGRVMSCFALTEPDVAGSDPTLIQTRAVPDRDAWVINGRKWFITNARRAGFAILVARTEDNPDPPQAGSTAFLVDLPADGWTRVREVKTMHGSSGHSEIAIEGLRVGDDAVLGELGQGHRLGQYRLGPARLAHCMRWLAQAEVAIDMMVARATTRYAHGSLLADKQAVQWMIAESALELYQCKLMILHAAYRIDARLDFRTEVSMAKHFVANTLNRVIDRSIQVHGALGYSTDTPLATMYQQARAARLADGPDEVHLARIAERVIDQYRAEGTTTRATGDLPL